MSEQLKMVAAGYFPKLGQISRASLVSVYHSYGKAIGKLLLHDLGYLVAAFLMIATSGTYQCLHKIGVDITLRNYEVSTSIYESR